MATNSPCEAREPVRIWVDQSGLHSIEASLVNITDEVALLKRPNGSKAKIPVLQLSQTDQEYIAGWSNRSSFAENRCR